MATKAHTGHFSNGIQQHSAGPLYPFGIRAVGGAGGTGPVGYQAFDGETGRTGPLHYGPNKNALAEADARAWLKELQAR